LTPSALTDDKSEAKIILWKALKTPSMQSGHWPPDDIEALDIVHGQGDTRRP
jgi:hypothetical protein